MALIDLGSDAYTWEKEYESTEKLHFSLLGILNERNRLPQNSQAFLKLSVQIRQQLSQLHSEIQSLKVHLEHLSQRSELTLREKERRSFLLEELLSKEKQIEQSLSDRNNRNPALVVSSIGPNNYVTNDYTSRMDEPISHRELRQQQVQIVEEQDRGLEELSRIIGRQRQIAQTIGEEVDTQNDLIDNITENVDRTRDRIARQTTNISVVDVKDRTCGYWVVIVLLLVAIVVVAAIPKPK